MLFNSFEFIFVFLPCSLLGFFYIARINHAFAAAWLALASLVFYGYWNPAYVGLLLGSIAFNYCFGLWISGGESQRKALLITAIASNLTLLGYYKYSNFFLSTINNISQLNFTGEDIILPLGISFFTFTQIAFLVDTYERKAKEYSFVHYALFVTYFPHLLAGPILHHKEMMPQFGKPSTYRFNHEDLTIGLTIFCIGLFKKVVIADNFGKTPDAVFSATYDLTFGEAWGGALCYSLQLYFDFSAYSDMAIGISRMFGIKLPLNFNSPYKAVNIIDFWRRWHMTLSRFLRDYLYIPLGGNRKGKMRRYMNLMITMLLGGLWHGANWTFIIWGGIHGLLLVANHAWHAFRRMLGQDPSKPLSIFWRSLAILLTFTVVTIAWVFFRSDSTQQAIDMIEVMMGVNGFIMSSANGLTSGRTISIILVGMLIVWFMPNTQEIMHRFSPAFDTSTIKNKWLAWRPSRTFVALHVLIALVALLSFSKLSPFLYFQF